MKILGNARVFGRCPNCGRQDTIYGIGRATCNTMTDLICQRCQSRWQGWEAVDNLFSQEKKKGNKLTHIELIHGTKEGVHLVLPGKSEIGCWEIITFVLNVALMTKFDFDPAFSQAGGIKGYYKGHFIELENNFMYLGLDVDYRCQGAPPTKEIVNFLYKMLNYLVNVSFWSGGLQHQRGEILHLPNNRKGLARAKKILRSMLIRIKGESFSRQVAKKIGLIRTRGKRAIPYITGPSPEG